MKKAALVIFLPPAIYSACGLAWLSTKIDLTSDSTAAAAIVFGSMIYLNVPVTCVGGGLGMACAVFLRAFLHTSAAIGWFLGALSGYLWFWSVALSAEWTAFIAVSAPVGYVFVVGPAWLMSMRSSTASGRRTSG